MSHDLGTEAVAAPTATATEVTAPPVSENADTDRPQTLAEALGEDGPGIAAQIESELSGMGDRLGILSQLPVTLTARLGTTFQSLGSILSVQPGQVIDLGRATSSRVELVANGVVVAYGEVVAVGNSLGVRVTALADT